MCVPIPLLCFQCAKQRKYNLILSFIFVLWIKRSRNGTLLRALASQLSFVNELRHQHCNCMWSSLFLILFPASTGIPLGKYPGFPLSKTNCTHSQLDQKKNLQLVGHMALTDRDTLAAGREKEGDNQENLQLHHWNLNFASNSPWLPVD